MRLLLDENLSPRLLTLVADLWPDSVHVRDVGLAEALDREVWDYASKHGLVLVSRDSDFHDLSFLHGPPPKVIWLRCGNCSTTDLAELLRSYQETIRKFVSDPESAVLVVPGVRSGRS